MNKTTLITRCVGNNKMCGYTFLCANIQIICLVIQNIFLLSANPELLKYAEMGTIRIVF